jgi:hypothetical protein
MMIYQLATKVIVWLGPEDNDSVRALDFLETFGSTIDVDWINYSMTPKALNLGEPSSCSSQTPAFPMRDIDIQALYHLFLRPWFERLRVRQEIGLATEALIACGTSPTLANIQECQKWHSSRKRSVGARFR